MSEEKEVISFEDSLPLILRSLEAMLFAGLGTSLMNIYRTYTDDVRKHSEEYTPVSFATFVKWIIDKPYYFNLNENRHLTRVFLDLAENPEAETIQKFIRFSIIWQLDLPNNTKTVLGIKFEEDEELNTPAKLAQFETEFELEKKYEFYDTLENDNLLQNSIHSPHVLIEDLEKLDEIIGSSWEIFGAIPEISSQFWTKITDHITARSINSET